MTPHRGHTPDRRYGTIGQKMLDGSYPIIPDQGNDAVIIRTPMLLNRGMRVYYFDVYSQGGTRIARRWGDLPATEHRAYISARQEVYPGQSRNVESTRPADAYSPPSLGGTLEGILRKTDLSDVTGILVYDPVPQMEVSVNEYYTVLIDRRPNCPNSAKAQFNSYYFALTCLLAHYTAGNLTVEARSIDQVSFENVFGKELRTHQKKDGLLLVPTNNLTYRDNDEIFISNSTINLLMDVVRDSISHGRLSSGDISRLDSSYGADTRKTIGARTRRDLTEFERVVRESRVSTFAVYDPSPDLQDVFPLGLIAPNGPELDGLIDELSDLGFGQCEEHCSRVRHTSGLVGESRFFDQDFRSLVQSNAIQKGTLFVPLEYLVVFNPLNFMYVPWSEPLKVDK